MRVRRSSQPILARFLTGELLDGEPRTDATWFRDGKEPLDATARASRWAHLAGWKRMLWRLGLLALSIFLFVAYQVSREVFIETMRVVLFGAVLVGAWMFLSIIQRQISAPVSGEPVTLLDRIGIGRPPSTVPLARARGLLHEPNKPLLGLTAGSKPVRASWDMDSPHILASMGSGGGKTVLARGIIAQHLAAGGRVVVLDIIKRGASHRWLDHPERIEGSEVLRYPQPASEALLALRDEMTDRVEKTYHGGEVDGPRILLVVEEANATVDALNRYWRDDLGNKGVAPAVKALADLATTGRQSLVHVLILGQQLTAVAAAGGPARENYGVRILARFSQRTARMLVPEVDPLPRSIRRVGRAQVCIGGECTETQLLYLSEDEARGLVKSRVLLPILTPKRDARKDTAQSSEPELVSLREAVQQGIVGKLGLQALQAARRRSSPGEFPEPKAHRSGRGGAGGSLTAVYDPDELRAWAANRYDKRRG